LAYGLEPETVKRLAADWPDARFAARKGKPGLVLADARPGRRGRPSGVAPLPADVPEAYWLRIEPDAVEIGANRPDGVIRGFQTLVLLAQNHGGAVPCGVIRDWPAIRYRGIHVDLKGYQPTYERLEELICLLARYKINLILLELEDKFQFASAPGVGVATAYTPAQLRRLGSLAAALGVQIVPKVQCLAHVDYLLKHPRYAALRENGHPYQFCMRNPRVRALWRGMAQEVMDCLPGHRFFHVGADESLYMDECPRCRRHRPMDNYGHIVGHALDAVRGAGREPILWDDVLRNADGRMSPADQAAAWRLARRGILMYWSYGYAGAIANQFPMLPIYVRQRLRVWGASGFAGCGPRWFQNVPPLRTRLLNIAAWTKTAVEHGLEGVVATGWTRISSFDPPTEVPEACWLHMLYAADSMWAGKSRTAAAFGPLAARSFYGVELPEHVAFLMDLDPAQLPESPGRFQAVRQPERLELLNAVLDTFRHEREQASFYEHIRAYQGIVGHRIADYRKNFLEGQPRRLMDSAERQAAAMRRVLGLFYEQPTVDDFIRSRFERDAEEGRRQLQAVRASALV